MLTACGPDDAELRRERLDAAVAATFEDSVAFNLTLDASDEALARLDEDGGPLAALVGGSSVAGVIEGDRLAAGLALSGVDLLQVRVVAPGEQYVRFNLGGLGAATGAPSAAEELEAALADTDLEPDARRAVLAAARGEWVRLVADAAGGPGAGSSVGAALEALLGAAEPVGHTGSLDEPFDGRMDIEVDVERALAAAGRVLAGIAPSAVPTSSDDEEPLTGRVLVEDGVVRSVVLELGPLTGGTGEGDAVELELVLDLRRLAPGGELVRAPETAAEVTAEQLQRAAVVLPGVGAAGAP